VSNLCYGTGKFRVMLRSESPSEFIGSLKVIYQSTTETETDKQKNTDRIVLRQAILGFIGNLCSDTILRGHIASNMQGMLDEVIASFKANVEKKPVMWMDLVTRELAVLINVSVEQMGQAYLVGRVIPTLDILVTGLLYTKTD
jgi:hypothetical protein